MDQDKFTFFVPAYLAKSGTGAKSYRVGGLLSTEKKDADGENIITKGLELDYFDGGFGKIKYEHDTKILHEPDNIIGFPDTVKKSTRGLFFEGGLIPFEGIPEDQLTPQAKMSKSAYGLLKSVEEWNRLHPEKPQKVGWSIEGEYLKREGGIVHKARITNVVLTTKPKNTGTFAQIIKSLETGYALSPEDKTGFGALQLESIDKCNKNNSKGEKKMFKSKEEAYKAYLEQGMSEDEAKKKAEEFKPELSANIAEEAFKSFASSKDSFQKAINSVKEAGDIKTEASAVEMKKSLENSIETMKKSKPEEINLTDYFEAKQTADVKMLENQEVLGQKVDLLAKSIMAIAEGLSQIAGGNESFQKSLNLMSQAEKLTAQGVTILLKGKTQQSGLTTDFLQQFRFEDNNKEKKELTKGQKIRVLSELAKEGKVPTQAVIEAENGYVAPVYEDMVKAKATEMFK
ncbi:MAG TPA: hypothetical protein VHO03_16910 [Ignavibacteriales bacterium]|nr:hypothetical protein [Ignavibacteriales bacterium]